MGMDEGMTRISRGGAQPEPDEQARLAKARRMFIQTTGRVDDAADMIRAEAFDAGWRARAGSSPAPSPARCQNYDHEVSLHQESKSWPP